MNIQNVSLHVATSMLSHPGTALASLTHMKIQLPTAKQSEARPVETRNVDPNVAVAFLLHQLRRFCDYASNSLESHQRPLTTPYGSQATGHCSEME